MRKEKWIVYRDRCQSLEKKLSLLESERDSWKGKAEFARDGVSNLSSECFNLSAERDRLRKALEEIARYIQVDVYPDNIIKAQVIARTALESSQPEDKCDCPPNGFCPKCKGKLDKRAAYCASQPEGREIDGWDESEINTLKGLLAEVPAENIIDRMGLESRLQRLLEKKESHYRVKGEVTVEEEEEFLTASQFGLMKDRPVTVEELASLIQGFFSNGNDWYGTASRLLDHFDVRRK